MSKPLKTTIKDFVYSFPFVVKWMVDCGEFSPDAFSKYLKKIKAPIWNTQEAFLESQADYLCLLARELNPRLGGKKAGPIQSCSN